jgi:hypothetical protein
MFDEIVLDPRLKATDAIALTEKLKSNGRKLSIRRSNLYEAPHFVILIQ